MSLAGFDPAEFVRGLCARPGVYRMLDDASNVIYVGKARNLKRRLTSWFGRRATDAKSAALLTRVRDVEITVTRSEGEALLLENQIIKRLKPQYNVLLRDDKSYPFIHLSTDTPFPRLSLHRGARRGGGRWFGPFSNASAVREALNLLHRIFRLRQCEDSVFRARTRPCLQHEIGRCSAPCTGVIDAEGYRDDVRLAELFLDGRHQAVVDALVHAMEAASERLDFERAALLRDRIAALRQVQEHQYVDTRSGDCDVVAHARAGGLDCIALLAIRGGTSLGVRTFFPEVPAGNTPAEVMAAFIAQHYGGREVPREILLDTPAAQGRALARMLTETAGHTVALVTETRGVRRRWMETARTNAEESLALRLRSRGGLAARIEALRVAFGLERAPERLECFDVSHSAGEATVVSCVVFDGSGPQRNAWRRYNIDGIQPGDDYAALERALGRRFARLHEGSAKTPDVLFIDGGAGQLSVARRVLSEQSVAIGCVAAIAKGPGRKAGQERIFVSNRRGTIDFGADSPALHLIQQIRDEAHRFAIMGHRARRARARNVSLIEDIPGVGPRRRRELLHQFGGLRELQRAGVEELAAVRGISQQLAQRIYERLHA